MSLTAPEQSATDQDQQAAAPAAPAAPTPAAPSGNGPWSEDLASLFQDDATRGAVDQFIRSKVQPHVTQLEQRAAQATDATRLWDDLTQKPLDTYVAITNEMFGEEAAQALLETLQQRVNAQEAAAPAQQPGQPSDPRVEALIQWAESKQAAETYDQEIARVSSDPQYNDVDTDLIHPFVAAADGNFDQAIKLYREYHEQFVAKTAPPPPPAETPAAPSVLGSDTGGAPGATPVVPKKQSLDEAIDDFMSEQRAARQAPPVIG